MCTAVYMLNRSPTKSLNNMTPFEAWHGKKPSVSHLRTFGCVAYAKIVGPGLKKLSDRSRKMAFIGYESGTKGYMLFDPSTKKLVISRDVIFDEKQPCTWTDDDSNAEQTTGSFVVHYELSDTNPTIGENVAFPAADEEGGGLVNQGGAVEHGEATPNSHISQGSAYLSLVFLQHHLINIQKIHLVGL